MPNRAKTPATGIALPRPNGARVYDYLLGGKDNFTEDRLHADRIAAAVPGLHMGARAQRALLARVVRYLVADAGIRQLLDIGAGLPAEENVHQIAQRADPAARVVYVDNDPVVLTHAKALLVENPGVAVADGDLRVPAAITGHPVVRAHLDWTRPIGLLLCGVLHNIVDDDRPAEIMRTLIDALPPGSYVFIQHVLDINHPAAALMKRYVTRALGPAQFRTPDQVRELFCGLELVPPGLVLMPDWRPDSAAAAGQDRPVALRLACAGVARKA